jgi:5'-nucleotidase
VTQADAAGHVLSRIKVQVDPAIRRRRRHRGAQRRHGAGQYPPDPESVGLPRGRPRAQHAPRWRGRWASAGGAVSRKASEAGESPLGDLIADAVLAATRAQGAQIAFMNNGGIRKDLDVRRRLTTNFGHAHIVLPFGNTLVVLDLTGAQLRACSSSSGSARRLSGATCCRCRKASRTPGTRRARSASAWCRAA